MYPPTCSQQSCVEGGEVVTSGMIRMCTFLEVEDRSDFGGGIVHGVAMVEDQDPSFWLVM
jgi:hypothetical protein